MCYNKEASLRAQIKRAIHEEMSDDMIERLKEELYQLTGDPFYSPGNKVDFSAVDEWPGLEEFNYYHVNGFTQPPEIVYSQVNPQVNPVFAYWGFIPHWVKTMKEINEKPYNLNPNAQSENMFSSRAFAKSARYGRCVVMIDAYYESHHYKGKTYPFRIFRKDGKPLYIACICRRNNMSDADGVEKIFNSFAMLTCEANKMLSQIHNNPKMVQRTGHRMLNILEEKDIDAYLKPYPTQLGEKGDPQEEHLFQQEVLNLCQPFPDELLDSYSVRNLNDRKEMPYIGNVPKITEEYTWPDLDYSRVKMNS